MGAVRHLQPEQAEAETSVADVILQAALDQALRRIRRGLPAEYVAARLEQATRRAGLVIDTQDGAR